MAKFCPQCGSKLPYAAAKFCSECGTPLGEDPGKDPEDKAPDASTARPVEEKREVDVSEAQRLTSELLMGMSKDELVDIILEKNAAVPRTTKQIFDASKIPFTTSFGIKIDTAVDKYVRLPKESGNEPKDKDAPVWRIKLLSANPQHKLIGIDVWGDVLIGRAVSGVIPAPDFDLTKYGGLTLGVSRRHALLRPTESNLFLIDLGSSNGTYRNGSRVSVGVAQPIRDRDALTFGGVHFMIKFVIKPAEWKSKA